MDSLDPLPSAEYASLLTLSPSTQQPAIDANQNITKPGLLQDPIYAQVTPAAESKEEPSNGRLIQHNTYVLRNPPLLLDAPQEPKHALLTAAESEEKSASSDPSVFSISGRRVVVSGDFQESRRSGSKENIFDSLENPSLWSNCPSESKEKISRLQICTEYCSLCLFIPGTFFCIITPWLLVPLYIVPTLLGSPFHTFIWVSFFGSTFLVVFGCIFGNIVWYKKEQKYKCFLHCGRGPKNHYWGDSFKGSLHTV